MVNGNERALTHVNWLSMMREPCNDVVANTSRTFSNELRYSWLIWQPCERALSASRSRSLADMVHLGMQGV